jgi:hypothetical protein
LRHFVDGVRNNKAISGNLYDGYRSLAVIEAAERSAKIGEPVALKQGVTTMVSP